MSEDTCQVDTQQLQDSLLAVKEDQVIAALGSSLDLLRQACQDAGVAPAVRFRVTCSCLVLQRAAALAACSDFLLPEVVAALQSRVHAVPPVRAALLDAHLPELLRVPPAFELLLRSLPHDSRQLGRLYAGVLASAPEGAPLLRPAGMLAAHARRELHKLMRGEAEGSLQLAPHLPQLLRLALRIRASAPGEAQALDSSESTALQPAASATGPACASPAAAAAVWAGDVAVRAAAACLRALRDPDALPRLLGRAKLAGGEGAADMSPATDCLALLIGSAARGEEGEDLSDSLATATALVEVLLEALLLSPQVAAAIEHATSGSAEQAQSPAPACAASSAGPAGRVPLAAANTAPQATAARVERACLDLLSLHEVLAELQAGDQADDVEEPPQPAMAGILTGAALLALADLALRQLQTGGDGEAAARRASTRTRTPASRPASGGRSCLPPRVAAHLLRLLTAAERAVRTPADVAGLALGFSGAAFRGPLPLVTYRLGPSLAATLGAKRRLGADDPLQTGSAATPGSAPGRRPKRPKATPTASTGPPVEAAPEAEATTETTPAPTVGVGPPPPRGFSRLRPCPGSAQPASGGARRSEMPPDPPPPQQLPETERPAAAAKPATAAKAAKAPARRITPTPVPAADAAQASVEEGVLDSLAAQKDEYDAYWAHYISVKEELVASVLQDDPGGEDGGLLTGDGTSVGQSPHGSGAGAGRPRGAGRAGGGDRSAAFREPEWQGLQAAALRLLADALQQAVSCGAGSDYVWQVLGREAAWRDRRQLALLGSRIEDPSVAPSPRLQAAMLGAQQLPHECLVLGLATRLAQYCIGPGPPVAPALAAGFLRLQRWLTERCLEEALPAGAERLVRPLELAGGVLLACVERSWLRCVRLEPVALGCLLSCALPAAEPEEAVLLAAVALLGAVQGSAANFPTWLGGCPPGWREMWARLPSPQHARAACAQLLAQAPHLLAELQQAGREEASVRSVDAGLQAQAALAAALAGYCSAVVEQGKAVATGAALRDCLLAAAVLLQAGAAACGALARRLAPAHAACAITPAPGDAKARRREQHGGLTPAKPVPLAAEGSASKPQDAGSVRGLSALAGTGSCLADAAGRLLAWRLQQCPRRAQEPAAAVAALRAAFAEAWDRVEAARPCPAEVEAWLRRAAGLGVGGCAAGERAPAEAEAEASEDDAARPPRGRWRPRNAYLRAALAEEGGRGSGSGGGSGGESGDESSYSDLEDFIVCKPERDYAALLAHEFAYRPAADR